MALQLKPPMDPIGGFFADLEGSEKVRKVRDNAMPFMPFYDVLCPFVSDNEKGQKGAKVAERVRDSETKRGRVSQYCPPGRNLSLFLHFALQTTYNFLFKIISLPLSS